MTWLYWGLILFLQNVSFTIVSRSRNSGSLLRHMAASFVSNGIWFASQIFIFKRMLDIMTGKEGVGMAVLTGAFYTVMTMVGSLFAHWLSLKTEKGKGAVGASSKYAQILVEDWEAVKGKYEQMISSKPSQSITTRTGKVITLTQND